MLGLVEQRQIDLFQVDEIDCERAVRTSSAQEPLRNGPADAAFARAGDDDMELHPVLWTGSDDNHTITGGDACRDGWRESGR